MSNTSNVLLAVGSTGRSTSQWVPRVTASQTRIILRVAGDHKLDQVDLSNYVASGDLAELMPGTHAKLASIVKACKYQAANESQAKRYWPRKVAAVLLSA